MNIRNYCFTFLSITLFSINTYAQTAKIESRLLGPFYITTHKQVKVFVKIDNIKTPGNIYEPNTDVSFAIIDTSGKELFRKSFPYEGDGNTIINAENYELPHIGKFVLIYVGAIPSCCRIGDFQLYGINGLGYTVTMTGVIPVGQKNADGNYFSLKYLNRENGSKIQDNKCENCEILLGYIPDGGFQFLTIYSYSTFYPNGAYTDGYDYRKLNRYPVLFDSVNYAKHRIEEQVVDQDIEVYYFSENGDLLKTTVTYKTNSKLKVIEVYYNGDRFLHVMIDDKDVYIPFAGHSIEAMCFHGYG